jgi:hypothetical protein
LFRCDFVFGDERCRKQPKSAAFSIGPSGGFAVSEIPSSIPQKAFTKHFLARHKLGKPAA